MISKYNLIKTVAEVKSITKASKILNLSQPALSHALNLLENEWGFSIFLRTSKGMVLTESGNKLMPLFNEILNLDERLNQEIQFLSGLKSGKVKVGTFPSVTTKWIPKILRKMNEEYPGIEVSILEENYEVIQQLVLEGQLDCGFVADEPFFESLSFTPLKKDNLLCIISAENPLAQLNKIPIEVLNHEPFILPGKGGAIELIKFFKVHNITPNIRYEIMDTNQSIVAMVESNLGISILPQLLLNKIPKTVVTRKLEIDFSRMIGLINLKNPSPATNLFINFLKDFLSNTK